MVLDGDCVDNGGPGNAVTAQLRVSLDDGQAPLRFLFPVCGLRFVVGTQGGEFGGGVRLLVSDLLGRCCGHGTTVSEKSLRQRGLNISRQISDVIEPPTTASDCLLGISPSFISPLRANLHLIQEAHHRLGAEALLREYWEHLTAPDAPGGSRVYH